MHIPITTDIRDYLVVGAGLAGLAFAREAAAHGKSVLLLDKGRSAGGRVATRRWGAYDPPLRTDHGAQFFTAKDARFRKIVDDWLAEPDTTLAVWAYGFPAWREGEGGGRIEPRPDSHPRYAPVVGMSALPRRLASGLEVGTEITVKQLERGADGLWRAAGETLTGETVTFTGRSLVLNLPPAQLLPLAGEFLPEEERAKLAAVEYEPTWTLLLHLAADLPGADWPAVDCAAGDHPTLAWVSRAHTKERNPASAPPVLVAHGAYAWSRAHLEDDSTAVEATLIEAVRELVGGRLPEVLDIQTHRWRYATAITTYPESSLYLPEHRIFGCGDWCDVGGRVEGALTSGWDLATRIVGEENRGV